MNEVDGQATGARIQAYRKRAGMSRPVLAGLVGRAARRLADFYVAYQPAQELVWMVADRAIAEAQETDDPYAIAPGHGRWSGRCAIRGGGRKPFRSPLDTCTNLEPYLEKSGNDWRGIYGALMFEVAYVYARRGRYGQAWAYRERADKVAAQLGPGYRHTQTSFSQVMKAHVVTLGVELSRPGEALKTAEAFDADLIPSIPRRSRHLIEVARAHAQRNERVVTLALLDKAERTAPETIRFNGHARGMALDLVAIPPASMRSELADLSRRLGLKV